MIFSDIDNSLLNERVAYLIIKAIIEGKLKPGQKLSEESIGKAIGVSRSPVREALHEIGRQGIIDVYPRKGAYVANWTVKDFYEYSEFRAEFEGSAAKLAAKKSTPEDIEVLYDLIEGMNNAYQKSNLEDQIKFDFDFHKRIVFQTKNSFIQKVFKLFEFKTMMYLIYSFYINAESKDTKDSFVQEHKVVADAIKNKNSDLSEKLMHQCIKRPIRQFLEKVENQEFTNKELDISFAANNLGISNIETIQKYFASQLTIQSKGYNT